MRKPFFEYSVSTGEFFENGVKVADGYSGSIAYRNNPVWERIANAGPIPRGIYRIGRAVDSKRTGPVVLPLTPVGHDALGRSGFQIHGDSMSKPGEASRGCIILPRVVRESVNAAVVVWKRVYVDVTD